MKGNLYFLANAHTAQVPNLLSPIVDTAYRQADTIRFRTKAIRV